jgi:tyrosyl-tRNA synthetase
MNPLIKELKERGLWSQTFGNLEECFSKPTTFYLGLDPTSDSLGIHHMVGLMVSKLMQQYGHKPIILVGGATCAIGDPSGKSEERKAISMETVFHNVECVKKQISKIIDFESDAPNAAIMVNNWDWYKDYKFLEFIRDVGKKITVNYLMAKENVRKRLEREGNGISFQEFSYGLLQGYDFVHLYQNYGCTLQIAGTDNLGNMVTGQDLVHKMLGKDDVCGLTWDLITCADGRKFGKTEGNSVWLDPKKTSPYQFMQYWLNVSDVDAEVFIKKFTLLPLDEINALIEKHRENPSARILQKELAKYMTCMVHSEEEYNKAVNATDILFGKGTMSDIEKLDESTLLSAMSGVAKVEVEKEHFTSGITVLELAAMHDKVPSKTEARKLIKSNGFSINKSKVSSEGDKITDSSLINGKYLLLQKGKKDYCLIVAKG